MAKTPVRVNTNMVVLNKTKINKANKISLCIDVYKTEQLI